MERKVPGDPVAALTPGADRPRPALPWQRKGEADAALALRASPRGQGAPQGRRRPRPELFRRLAHAQPQSRRGLAREDQRAGRAGIRLRYRGEPLELRLPARVVRLTAEGAAVRFGRYDDETYTQLVNLLYV